MQFNMLLTLLLSIIGLAAASPAFGLATSTTESVVTTTLAITSGSKLTIPGPLVDLQNEAIDACKDWCIQDVCGDYRGTDMYGQCIEPCINSHCLRELPTEISVPPARRQIDSCDDLCHYVCKDKPYDECEGPCVEQNCEFTQFTKIAQRAVATDTASLAPQPTTVPVPGCQDRVSATPPVATPTTISQGPSPMDEVIGRRDMPADCSVQCKYICGNSLECIPSCMTNCESHAPSNKAAVDASSDIAGGIRRRDVPTDCSVHCKYICGNSPECLPSCIANCESTTLSKATVDASPRVTGAVRRDDVPNDCSIHCKYVCGNNPECIPSCIASCESAPPSKVASVVRRRVSRAQPPSLELARRQDDALVQCEKQCLDETCGESNPDCVDTCVSQCMADGPFATIVTKDAVIPTSNAAHYNSPREDVQISCTDKCHIDCIHNPIQCSSACINGCSCKDKCHLDCVHNPIGCTAECIKGCSEPEDTEPDHTADCAFCIPLITCPDYCMDKDHNGWVNCEEEDCDPGM